MARARVRVQKLTRHFGVLRSSRWCWGVPGADVNVDRGAGVGSGERVGYTMMSPTLEACVRGSAPGSAERRAALRSRREAYYVGEKHVRDRYGGREFVM